MIGSNAMKHRFIWLPFALLASMPFTAWADLLISANDGKAELVNGVNTVPDNPVPDNVTID